MTKQIYENNVKKCFKIKKYERDEEYMKKILDELKTNNNKYKRITISPLRYAGGKSKAIGLILENMPKLKYKRIISPFFGGGSFELYISQILNIQVIGFDIFNMLVNFWNIIINNKTKFIKELKKLKVNKTEFTKNRHILLNYWNKIKPTDLIYKTQKKIVLNDKEKKLLDNDKIKQAVYYYYNMSLSYSPMFLGCPSSNEIKEDKFKHRINKLKKMEFKNISVSCLDFEKVIKKYPNDFLFLDPPYYLDKDSKMFKGMYPNCNFAIHHNNFKHKILLKLLKKHKGGFFITYNNCEVIREWYKNYTQIFPEWQYTYGQGEKRIGKNRLNGNGTHIKKSHEIFIICPPL